VCNGSAIEQFTVNTYKLSTNFSMTNLWHKVSIYNYSSNLYQLLTEYRHIIELFQKYIKNIYMLLIQYSIFNCLIYDYMFRPASTKHIKVD